MKAMVYRKYGSPDVLRLEDIDKPTPTDDEVLVRVRAASVNPFDWYSVNGWPYVLRLRAGLLKPKIIVPGIDFAGAVEAVGRNVREFQPGDEVFGMRDGAYAEYLCVRKVLVKKPANLTFEQAAAVPMAGLTALQGLRDVGHIQSGQRVLINGASGGVGTFAVQIAKSFGAEVTGVCSTRNMEMVRSLGADHVIDYTKENFTSNGQRYDLILDAAGSHSLSDRKRALTPNGILVAVGGTLTGLWIAPVISPLKTQLASVGGSKKMTQMLTRLSRTNLMDLQELLEAGTVTPVIDRRYALSEVPEALRHMGQGHARGKTVITV